MSNIRLIARLDIKGPNLVKGIHLEGFRVIGGPYEHAKKYYQNGVDELIYMDTVASLYGRNSLIEIIKHTACDIFVPLTVGGGIRSVDDVRNILRAGADKVAINTAAVKRPELIAEVSNNFGCQCMVLSIEAKRDGRGGWEVFTDNGREHTGMGVVEWVKRGEELGAGEIFLTSVDQEGTRKGFDVELVKIVSNTASVPVIASGGMGEIAHLLEVIRKGNVDAVAMADILHYKRRTLYEIRNAVLAEGIKVREI